MFTLIIPYRNREKFLPRLFQSLLRCTVLPEHIIWVDNGSTDGSAQLCQTFAAQHPELPNLLLNASRPCASIARNVGLAQVRTEWVYFFDSDDELSPDYFQEVKTFIQTHPDLDLVAAATTMVFSDGTEVARKVLRSTSPADQLLSAQLATQGMFLRTSFLRKIGGWNENLLMWNDWELGFRLLHRGARTAWFSSRAWHRIHQHGDSITGSNFTSRHAQIISALAAIRSQLQPNDNLLHLALAFREVLIAGKLYNEGSRELSKAYYHHALRGEDLFDAVPAPSEAVGRVSGTTCQDTHPRKETMASHHLGNLSKLQPSDVRHKTSQLSDTISSTSISSISPSPAVWRPSCWASLFLRLLYRYTCWGGRGGWYLAVRLTHWLG